MKIAVRSLVTTIVTIVTTEKIVTIVTMLVLKQVVGPIAR